MGARCLQSQQFSLPGEAMKESVALLLTLAIAGSSFKAWAGPAEEVAQLAAPRLQALHDGNVEAYTAAFADNAVFQSSLSPFRVEGKEAIRAQLTELFTIFPKRKVLPRQSSARVYNDDLVITNSYSVLNLTDSQGRTASYPIRSS